jgi:hypothetical protein
MQRQLVDSSGILSVGYDDWSKTLEIEYPGGAIYDYARVPEVLYRDLLEAESKRRFVNLFIKPYFQHEEIDAGEPLIYVDSNTPAGKRAPARRASNLPRHRGSARRRRRAR